MIQERLIQFIEYKGLTKYKFYQLTKLSNGFLDKKGTIGADKCEVIYSFFPEINLEWLLTGKGSMLKEGAKSNLSQNITGNSNIQSGNGTNITGDSSQQVKELQKQLKERDKEIERLKTQVDKLFKMIP
jgi:hypothetical protein